MKLSNVLGELIFSHLMNIETQPLSIWLTFYINKALLETLQYYWSLLSKLILYQVLIIFRYVYFSLEFRKFSKGKFWPGKIILIF